jgi:hypothetical protein
MPCGDIDRIIYSDKCVRNGRRKGYFMVDFRECFDKNFITDSK